MVKAGMYTTVFISLYFLLPYQSLTPLLLLLYSCSRCFWRYWPGTYIKKQFIQEPFKQPFSFYKQT